MILLTIASFLWYNKYNYSPSERKITMSKIKILSLFFALTMLLCALVSCAEDPYYKFYRKLEPLTDEQIEECNSDYRNAYFGPYDEYIASKTEDVLDQAQKAYFGMKFVQNNVYTPYLGTFSGAIVVGSALNMEGELYMIGDTVLQTGSIKKITVYKDGQFVSISQAYNSGWLTDADIAAISERIELYDAKMAEK